jgi:hypothetical protein
MQDVLWNVHRYSVCKKGSASLSQNLHRRVQQSPKLGKLNWVHTFYKIHSDIGFISLSFLRKFPFAFQTKIWLHSLDFLTSATYCTYLVLLSSMNSNTWMRQSVKLAIASISSYFLWILRPNTNILRRIRADGLWNNFVQIKLYRCLNK